MLLVTRVGSDINCVRPKDNVKFSHSLSELYGNKFLLISPSKIISFPSLDALSIKSSNLSSYAILESGGRYIFPIRNEFTFS